MTAPRIALAAALVSSVVAFAGCNAGAPLGSGVKLFPLTQIGAVNGLTVGPDGRGWFTLATAKALGAANERGDIQMFQNPINIDADAQAIADGPDGALWFTQVNPHVPVDSGPDMIGRITTSGKWAEYPIASWDALPGAIVAGPDHAMWFTERHANAIGRITMAGKIKEFALPEDDSGPTGITLGSDGRIWFTETDGDRIGAIDPATERISEYPLTEKHAKPGPIALGPGGELYFIELGAHELSRISSAGTVSKADASAAGITEPIALVAASDRSIWVADAGGSIACIAPARGSRPAPESAGDGSVEAVAVGKSGAVWFAVKRGPTYGYAGTGAIGLIPH